MHMHPFPRSLRFLAPWLAAALLGMGAGCSAFRPAHQVAVDAITGQPGTGGTSYQFVARDPRSGSHDLSQHGRALACVEAALADKGMFEAPPKTEPDMLIAVDCGIGNHIPRVNAPPVVEKYLHLSARKILDPNTTKTEELWNVRVTTTEPDANLDNCLPLLATVAADYAGLDTQVEKTISVLDNSPAVARIKDVMHSPAQIP